MEIQYYRSGQIEVRNNYKVIDQIVKVSIFMTKLKEYIVLQNIFLGSLYIHFLAKKIRDTSYNLLA